MDGPLMSGIRLVVAGCQADVVEACHLGEWEPES